MMNEKPQIIKTLDRIIIGCLLVAAVSGALAVREHNKAKSTACDCWEHKPMPFCEVLGLPVRGKIAVMPETPIGTDP